MRSPPSPWLVLCVALCATSQSGNLIRIGDAHPVVMAAWRLGLASLLLAPLAGRRLASLAALSRRDGLLLLLSGVALSAHLCTWIAAVQLTTVANATIFYAVNPVLTALAARWVLGERGGPWLAAAIALGLGGVAVAAGGDFRLDPAQLPGDAMAVLCSALCTVYLLAGKRVRQVLDTRVYVTATYGIAAVTSFAVAAVLGLPAVGYSPRTWLCFWLLALVPTFLGHTGINHALRYLDAGRVSTATLAEPLLAGVVAYFALGEQPSVAALAGYVLIAASVLALVRDSRTPPEAAGAAASGGVAPT